MIIALRQPGTGQRAGTNLAQTMCVASSLDAAGHDADAGKRQTNGRLPGIWANAGH